jgi:hypothetical protein
MSWHFDGESWTHDCPASAEPLIIGEQEWSEDDDTPATVIEVKVSDEE